MILSRSYMVCYREYLNKYAAGSPLHDTADLEKVPIDINKTKSFCLRRAHAPLPREAWYMGNISTNTTT